MDDLSADRKEDEGRCPSSELLLLEPGTQTALRAYGKAMTLEPPRRKFPEASITKGSKDIDGAARARKLKTLAFALYGGVPLGAAAGYLLGHPVLGGLLGPALIYAIVTGIAAASGKGASALYMPSGSTTPRPKEYSRAKALEVRGQYEDAIRAYEVEILDSPGVADPYLRIARLYRDEIKDIEAAVTWFKRAQQAARLSPGEAIRSQRELAEIFLHTLKEPRKAAPELARLAEAHPSTPDGEWAARELAYIKEEMERERKAPPPGT
jgi:tetratricopeptide (TPR) repeat protein